MDNNDFRHLITKETKKVLTQQGRNIVVVIGINEYIYWQRLHNAVNDALGIYKLFVDKLGFMAPIAPLLNGEATQEAITTLVQDRLSSLLKPNDNLILFFAGHGHTKIRKVGEREIETGYIIPVKARTDHWSDYITISSFLSHVSQLPPRHILVALDACRSGFALGEAMQLQRSQIRYEQDLVERMSRKVITSARRDQDAVDNGPIAGHSLFAGTLINGLNWGTADLDGNGLVTSSELGLYLQQQVGQSSHARQTPDFGSFYFDDRGELIISLREDNFDTLKARAYTALRQGEMADFRVLAQKVSDMHANSPEALYLQYRLHHFDGDTDKATEIFEQLSKLELTNGIIPLTVKELKELNAPHYSQILPIQSVLFADNHRDFLDTRTEFLENAGYQVLKASTLEDAQELMNNRRVHLAILDIRMVNDEDSKDTSGLMLAKESKLRSIPKIILTDHPDYQIVREALGPALNGLPPAVGFLAKPEGPDAMIRAVRAAFARHVHINWGLLIRWRESLSFLQLVNLIDPKLDNVFWFDRANELEDLFRKLFFDCVQLTIGRLLIKSKSKVSVEIYAYNSENTEAQFILTCGSKQRIAEEDERYNNFRPRGSELVNTIQLKTIETVHFAAILYQLVGGDWDKIIPFPTLYLQWPTNEVLAVIDDFFTTTLASWHAQSRGSIGGKNLEKLCQDWLELDEVALHEEALERRLEVLCTRILTSGVGWFDYTSRQLTFRLSDGSSVFYPNPIVCLNERQITIESSVLSGIIHGCIDASNIFADQAGQTWMVNFGKVTRGALLCDLVALEMTIKLDLFNSADLQMRHRLEKQLLVLTTLNAPISSEELPTEFDKPLRTIERIRHLAVTVTGSDPKPYFIAILFYTLARLTEFDPNIRYTKQELVIFAHSLLLAAMLCEKLTKAAQSSTHLPDEVLDSLWLHESNREVWVEGRKVELTLQDFDIIAYLYRNRGQLCSRQEIVEKALGETYKEEATETSRLNSAMSRLRQKIESDPEHPKYLITVRGYGYKLM